MPLLASAWDAVPVGEADGRRRDSLGVLTRDGELVADGGDVDEEKDCGKEGKRAA